MPNYLQTTSPERRREISRMGGLAISKNTSYMSAIGTRGGTTTSQDREHMRAIGRIGGKSSWKNGKNKT